MEHVYLRINCKTKCVSKKFSCKLSELLCNSKVFSFLFTKYQHSLMNILHLRRN